MKSNWKQEFMLLVPALLDRTGSEAGMVQQRILRVLPREADGDVALPF